jgi:hypothetical protein
MTYSVPNDMAAAHCLLSNLAEAGLNLVPQSQADTSIDSTSKAEPVTIMFLGTDNSQEASDLLIAIADKGLNVPKDFVHIKLLKKDSQAIESTLGTYSPEVIIVLGLENGIQLFPNHGAGSDIPRGQLLHSSYCSNPVLITESLKSMLSDPDSKKSCWKDLQAAKEILNN